MLQLCDICGSQQEKVILYRTACDFLNDCLNQHNDYLSQNLGVQQQRWELFNRFFPTPIDGFFLSALQFVGRPKDFRPENKKMITDACNSLLWRNNQSQTTCFSCFYKELKKISSESQTIENRLDNLERVVYERGESSRAAQNRLDRNTNSMMAIVGDVVVKQEQLYENQIKLHKKQKNLETKQNKIKEDVKKVENQNRNLQENQQTIWKKVFPLRVSQTNIYDFDTYYHWIGWYVFLVLAGYIGRKVYRIKTRKRKESKNYLVEIRKIFQEWQLNMYASTGAYVAGFFLIQQAIAKWINPRISNWLTTQKTITIIVVSLLVGIGFYLDGIITSSLKTPLQRLGIRIENSDIDEKTKKALLSKTQQVSELFKETLKRFGLLAVVGILTKLIEAFWNKDILSYLSYAVPIAGAIKIIWEVDKSLKKLKLGGSKKN